VVTLLGAGFVGAFPLDRSVNTSGYCSPNSTLLIYVHCVKAVRDPAQIPIAVVIGLAGVGAAYALARRRRPPSIPPVNLRKLPRGWR
jgi:hypothetical protein